MNSRVAGLVAGVMMLLVIGAGQAYGQSDSLWWRTYGSRGAWATSILETQTGGYIISGATSFGADSELWLLCIAPNGDSLWSGSYDVGAYDRANCLIQTTDGGYAIVGTTREPNAWRDGVIVRTDSRGELLWKRTFGGPSDDQFTAVVQTADGGFALGGHANLRDSTSWDFWLFRLDADGDSLWSSVYGSMRGDFCECMTLMDDGGFALAGYTLSSAKCWLVRTNADGDSLWSRIYGAENPSACHSMLKVNDGSLLLAGENKPSINHSLDFWVIKVDAEGDYLWSKFYATPGSNETKSIHFDLDGGFSLLGESDDNLNANVPWLVKMNANGDSLWARKFDYNRWECHDHLQTSSGRYAIVGLVNDGSLLFLETGIDPLGAEPIAVGLYYSLFSSFPSPFNSSLSISYSSPTNAPILLSLVDLSGRTLQSNWIPGTSLGKGVATLGTTALPSGNYFVIVGGKEKGVVMPVRCLK